jgi:hypothetical protein
MASKKKPASKKMPSSSKKAPPFGKGNKKKSGKDC